jgi:hypothetical protein
MAKKYKRMEDSQKNGNCTLERRGKYEGGGGGVGGGGGGLARKSQIRLGEKTQTARLAQMEIGFHHGPMNASHRDHVWMGYFI